MVSAQRQVSFTAAEEEPRPPVRRRARPTAPRTLSALESSMTVVRRLFDYFMTRLPLYNCRLALRGPLQLSTLYSALPHISFSSKRSSYMVVCFVRFTALSEVNVILTHALYRYQLLESKHRRCAHRGMCRRVSLSLSFPLPSVATDALLHLAYLHVLSCRSFLGSNPCLICARAPRAIQIQTSLPCGARSSPVPNPLYYERTRCFVWFVSSRREGGLVIERRRRTYPPQRCTLAKTLPLSSRYALSSLV